MRPVGVFWRSASLWALGLLLLLPIRLIAQPPPPPRFHPQIIGITADQQHRLEEFFADAEKQRREVGSRLRSLYHELEGVYDVFEFDQPRALDLRKQIVEQQGRLLALHGENEIRLRKILNPEQFARLREQMKSWRAKDPHHNHGPRPDAPADKPAH